MRPSSSTCSLPRNPSGGWKSVAVRASRRRKSGWAGASRSISTSGRTICSPPSTCRKSNATAARTRCERSGCSRQSRNTRFQSASDMRHCRLRASTSALSVPKPHRASPSLTSPATSANQPSARRVGVGQRVVLVGGERRLAAGGRPERHPRPRARGDPVLRRGRDRPGGSWRVSDCSAITRPMSVAATPAADQRDDHLRQVRRRLDHLVDGARRGRSTGAGRTACGSRGTSGRSRSRRPPGSPFASTTGRWWMPASSMSIIASTASRSGGKVSAGRHHQLAHGRVVGAAAGDELAAQVGVGDDPEPVVEPHEQARHVGVGHQPGGLARRSSSGVHSTAGRCTSAPRWAVRWSAWAWATLPVRTSRSRSELATNSTPAGLPSRRRAAAGVEQEADRRLARAHVERGRKAREQRRVAERLARLEHVDHADPRGRARPSRCGRCRGGVAGAPSSTSTSSPSE